MHKCISKRKDHFPYPKNFLGLSWMLSFLTLNILLSCNQEKISESVDTKKTDSLFLQASKHFKENNAEKAFYEYNLAKEKYLENKDSISAAKCLTEMASVQEYASDNLGSIETNISAIKLLQERNHKHQEILFDNYLSLGINSASLKNYSEAEKMYLKAITFAQTDFERIKAQHNLAIVHYKLKEYKKAVEIQDFVIQSLSKENYNYPKALINYSRYLSHYNSKINPIKNYHDAILLYKKNEDSWGLAAAYSYLSEYYEGKNADSSLYYAKKMYNIAKVLESPTDQLEALQNIIRLDKNSQKYFTEYAGISDSLTVNTNRSKSQFATIRYDSEKNLSKNLRLEKTVSQKNNLLIFSIFVFLITAGGSIIWYKARQKKIQLIADNQIKEERLQTSKKVHDVVANGLYQMMSSLEHQQNINRNDFLDKLESMYQKSRDISYDGHLKLTPNFIKEQISEIGETFQNENLQVFIIGNEVEIWRKIPEKIQEKIYLLTQELFINTKKHAAANRIILKFEIVENSLSIHYQDNGNGIDAENFIFGNGLKHIHESISNHNGNLKIFDKKENSQGFKILIRIPIQENV